MKCTKRDRSITKRLARYKYGKDHALDQVGLLHNPCAKRHAAYPLQYEVAVPI